MVHYDLMYNSGFSCKVSLVDKDKKNGIVNLLFHTSDQVFDAVKLGIQGGAKRVIIEVIEEEGENDEV